jgi:hypothetical protein
LEFSFTSFLLLIFKRANSDHLEFFFRKTIFKINLEKHLFPQPFLIGKEWLLLVDGKEKESRMNVCSSFEKMDGVRIMLGV